MNFLHVFLAAVLSFALSACATAPPTGPQVAAWETADDGSTLFLMDSQLMCSAADGVEWRDLIIEEADRSPATRLEGCWHADSETATIRAYVHGLGFGVRPMKGLEFEKPPPYTPLVPDYKAGAPHDPSRRPA